MRRYLKNATCDLRLKSHFATLVLVPALYQVLPDAAIVVEEDGTIFSVHDMHDDGAEETMAELMAQGVELADFRGKLILPGFVDGHTHAPQVRQYAPSFLCGISGTSTITYVGQIMS